MQISTKSGNLLSYCLHFSQFSEFRSLIMYSYSDFSKWGINHSCIIMQFSTVSPYVQYALYHRHVDYMFEIFLLRFLAMVATWLEEWPCRYISITIGWDAIKFGTDVHGPQRMNPVDISDPQYKIS